MYCDTSPNPSLGRTSDSAPSKPAAYTSICGVSGEKWATRMVLPGAAAGAGVGVASTGATAMADSTASAPQADPARPSNVARAPRPRRRDERTFMAFLLCVLTWVGR